MYLHLGQNVVVPECDIIGVFDLDNTTGSRITRVFLNESEKAGRVISVSEELPRSFVVCCLAQYTSHGAASAVARYDSAECAGMEVYLSQLSPQTLLKRSGTLL